MNRAVFVFGVMTFALAKVTTAFAHEDRVPGLVGWVEHTFTIHLESTLIFISVFVIVFAACLLRLFLEPDYAREARRRRGGDGGTGCSGCSGCGGD